MASNEDPKGAQAPNSDSLPENGSAVSAPGESLPSASQREGHSEPTVTYSQTTDDPYGYGDDAYSYEGATQTAAMTVTTPEPAPLPAKYGGGGGAAPPPKPPDDEADDEEDGMLR